MINLKSVVQKGSKAATGTLLSQTTVDQDANDYRYICVQLTGTFSLTVTWYTSNDGSTWIATPLTNSSGTSATTATATGMYRGTIYGRFFKADVTSYSSGTVVAVSVASTAPVVDTIVATISGVATETTLAVVSSNTTPLVPGGSGSDTTGTAGTPEQLNGGSSQACRAVRLTNVSSSPIAYGFGSSVDVAANNGAQIAAGKSEWIFATNLNLIYVDVTTNGDRYNWTYYT